VDTVTQTNTQTPPAGQLGGRHRAEADSPVSLARPRHAGADETTAHVRAAHWAGLAELARASRPGR
jgi:hypothetical protein